MAVDQIKKRLAAMQSNINGVVKAYPQMPKKHNGSFPIFTNHAGPATYDLRTFGEQAMLRPRTYIMRLWVKQVGLDTEYAPEEDAEPWFDIVAQYFAARPGLELETEDAPSGIEFDAELVGDSGIQLRQWSGEWYVTIDFQLRVYDVMAINYTDG